MNTPQPTTVPALGLPRTSMDELMLAMDIVDTLRHEQSLVERELAAEQRDDAFVARVKQIYASQGIEVSDALVRQGVEALKQDRFAYVPPKRTFAVRLAEVWVDRWRWTKRSMIAGFVGVFGYAIVALPNAWMDAREYRGYASAVAELHAATGELQRRDQALASRVAAWAAVPELVAVPVSIARDAIASGRIAITPTLTALAALKPVEVTAFANAPDAAREALQSPRKSLEELDARIDAFEADASRVEALTDAANRLAQIDARFAGLQLSDAVSARVAGEQAQIRAALASGDAATAGPLLRLLEASATQVNLGYTLRIVNRDGVQSGLWRYHQDAPDGKNYYLVVEAVDADGQVLSLPVTNEETQRAETVTRFAIRVPQAEYERVKADKLDNGLIDDAIVGEKRRGERDVDYRVAVAGGAITEW
ncbi:MAG TPA: DUF6384 family protein [Patescibacteria group bacterium]|nr:DUF6384 family protein [Patescibacteria group bacterium]